MNNEFIKYTVILSGVLIVVMLVLILFSVDNIGQCLKIPAGYEFVDMPGQPATDVLLKNLSTGRIEKHRAEYEVCE